MWAGSTSCCLSTLSNQQHTSTPSTLFILPNLIFPQIWKVTCPLRFWRMNKVQKSLGSVLLRRLLRLNKVDSGFDQHLIFAIYNRVNLSLVAESKNNSFNLSKSETLTKRHCRIIHKSLTEWCKPRRAQRSQSFCRQGKPGISLHFVSRIQLLLSRG